MLSSSHNEGLKEEIMKPKAYFCLSYATYNITHKFSFTKTNK